MANTGPINTRYALVQCFHTHQSWRMSVWMNGLLVNTSGDVSISKGKTIGTMHLFIWNTFFLYYWLIDTLKYMITNTNMHRTWTIDYSSAYICDASHSHDKVRQPCLYFQNGEDVFSDANVLTKINLYILRYIVNMITYNIGLLVNIGSGNGLVPSGNKPLPEPVLTKISDVIWRH